MATDNYSDTRQEISADGLPVGVEFEEEVPYPFDAEKIAISNNIIPLETVVRRLRQKTILAPEIQRGAGLWDDPQQSRLIESLMLRIPLPLFYVAADRKEHWNVVDGLQRITAIRRFIVEQEFKLKELEFMSEFNGKKFEELPQKFQNRILETQLQFAIIDPSTPSNVQRNVFKRLNTGGLPLTSQEIRHALYYGEAARLLKALAESNEFKEATANGVNDSRMAGRELILRFLAFLIREPVNYSRKGDMDGFLSETMQLINKMPALTDTDITAICGNETNLYSLKFTEIEPLVALFKLAMKRASILFGGYAFRKSVPGYNLARTPINKSLFEVWSVQLSQLSEAEFKALLKNKNLLFEQLHTQTYGQNQEEFSRWISRDSHKSISVRKRNEIISKIIKTTIEH